MASFTDAIAGRLSGGNQNPYDYYTQHDQWAAYTDRNRPMYEANSGNVGGGGGSGGGSSGGTDWGAIINGILSFAPSVLDAVHAFGGGSTGVVGQGKEAAAMADPFAPHRGQYQDRLAQTLGQPGGAPNPYASQLQALLTDPNSFKTDPGYQFALGQGQQAINRGSNALYGTGRTGSLGPELAKYTEGYANQAFDKRLDQLTALSGQEQNYNSNMMQQLLTASGANQGNPAEAGKLLLGGYRGQADDISSIIHGLTGKGGYGIPGGIGGFANEIIKMISGRGFDMSGGSVNPTTGEITYGSGPNASTGVGNQSGWPGEDGGTYSGGSSIFDETGPSIYDSGFFDP